MKKLISKFSAEAYELSDLLLGLFFIIGIPILWWFELQEFAIGFLVLLVVSGIFRK